MRWPSAIYGAQRAAASKIGLFWSPARTLALGGSRSPARSGNELLRRWRDGGGVEWGACDCGSSDVDDRSGCSVLACFSTHNHYATRTSCCSRIPIRSGSDWCLVIPPPPAHGVTEPDLRLCGGVSARRDGTYINPWFIPLNREVSIN